jgi:hypothetical protein
MSKMASIVKSNPEKLVRAFRKVAKKLGCDKSEQRFQEALFAIGTQKVGDARKPVEPFSKRRSRTAAGKHVTQKRSIGLKDEDATPALD